MTEKRARAFHRAMWRWLAKHPGKRQFDWPGWKLMHKDVTVRYVYLNSRSFPCDIADNRCRGCPIKKKAHLCRVKGSIMNEFWEQRENPRKNKRKWADVCNRMADAWREIPEN